MTSPGVWEMLHVASDLSCKPTRRSPAHKAEPRRQRFPSRGTENLIWPVRRLVNAQIYHLGVHVSGCLTAVCSNARQHKADNGHLLPRAAQHAAAGSRAPG